MNHFKKIVVIVIATFLPRVNSTFGSNVHGFKHRELIDIKELENSVIKNRKKRNKEFIEKRLAKTKYETLRKEKEEKEKEFKEKLLFVKNKISRLSRCKNENKKSEIGTFDSEIEKLKKKKERIENIINPIQAEMNRIYKAIKEEADELLPTGGIESMLETKIKRNKEIKERNKELKAYLEKIKKEAKKRKELKRLEEEKQKERLEEEKQKERLEEEKQKERLEEEKQKERLEEEERLEALEALEQAPIIEDNAENNDLPNSFLTNDPNSSRISSFNTEISQKECAGCTFFVVSIPSFIFFITQYYKKEDSKGKAPAKKDGSASIEEKKKKEK